MKILKRLFWFVVLPVLLTLAYGGYVSWELFTQTFAHGTRSGWAGHSGYVGWLWLAACGLSFFIGWQSRGPTARNAAPMQ